MSIYGSLLETVNVTNKRSETGYVLTNLKLENTFVSIDRGNKDDIDSETISNLEKDFTIIKKNYKNHIKNEFIPWLKSSDNKINIDDKTILNQLKLYDIIYGYHDYAEKYSPTGKAGKFGSFEFCFEAEKGSELYKQLLPQPAAIRIIVYNNTTKKVTCYDI